MTNIIET